LQHKDGQDVKDLLNTENSAENKKMYEKIRNVGNHLHNVKVLRDGQGQLFVSYRQSHNQRVAETSMDLVLTVTGITRRKSCGGTLKNVSLQCGVIKKTTRFREQPAITKIKRRKHYFKTSNRVHEKRRNKSQSQK